MQRRSLLDYLAENDGPQPASRAPASAELLEQRLAELERKLATAAKAEIAAPIPDRQSLSSQIGAVLNRQREPMPQARLEPQARELEPVRPRPRVELAPPPLAAERPAPVPDRSAEFIKFVEAVHLVGQAAQRFLPSVRADAPPVDENLRLTAALKDTIAAFQAMTADLASAAGEIRRVADVPPVEARPEIPERAGPREDAELLRLQDDLDDLRERLGALARRRSRRDY